MNSRGKLHLYFGAGKGKTTAALGLAVRASGAGMKVALICFFKEGAYSSESGPLKALGITREEYGDWNYGGKPSDDEQRLAIEKGLGRAVSALENGAEMIVLDEITHALGLGIIRQSELTNVIAAARENGVELVMTGREAPEWLIREADYATEMVKHKHPFDEGGTARKAIEY